jgi:hypothetical protein
METVEITHPDLPGVRRSVPKTAFEHHHIRAGWELAATPDERERTRLILVKAGVDPGEAERVAEAAYPREEPPPTGGEKASEAPAPAGASALGDQSGEKPTPRRRASREEGAE